MENYYKVLGVSPNATAAEIKRAYRKKAKELHPDVSGIKSENFYILASAYEVLSDIHQKSMFDTAFVREGFNKKDSKTESSFNYRRWLSEQQDEKSRCKLIFWDLMHHREDDAVAEFKKLNTTNVSFKLSSWFTREDFMDYGFILAEELVFRAEYYEALLLLEQIIRMEQSFAYFRHFFPEVTALTRNILRRHTVNLQDELALDVLERALDLGFGAKDEAFFLLKMADLYNKAGDLYTARLCLAESVKLDSALRIPLHLKSLLTLHKNCS